MSSPDTTVGTVNGDTWTCPCSWHHCITPIREGEAVVLLDSGWVHALHIEETP